MPMALKFWLLIPTLTVAGLTAVCGHAQGNSGVEVYGSSAYVDTFPNVIFLLGEIQNGDSLEFRKALRSHPINLVVLASPGGSVVEGLQIAGIIHDQSISTYIPINSTCASACSYVFFAGANRLAEGALAVHQFFSGSPKNEIGSSEQQATSNAQYVAAEIIGALNEYNTPPFVYEKMFSTDDIYFFNEVEKRIININPYSIEISENLFDVNIFVDNLNSVSQAPPLQESIETPLVQELPTPALPDPNGFTVIYDTDLFGMDLLAGGIKNVTLTQCQDECASSPICQSFTYLTQLHWCWPKTGVGEKMFKSDAISGVKNPYASQLGAVPEKFTQYSGQDIPNGDIFENGIRGISLAQCQAHCSEDSGCVAYAYVIKKSWCWPKYTIGNLMPVSGIVSGVKY